MLKRVIGDHESLELNDKGLTVYESNGRIGRYDRKTIPYKSIDEVIVKRKSGLGNGIFIIKMKHTLAGDIRVEFSKDYKTFCDLADKVNGKIKAPGVLKTAIASAVADRVIRGQSDNNENQFRCICYVLDHNTKVATPVNGLLKITNHSLTFEGNRHALSYRIIDIANLQLISEEGLDIVVEDEHFVISETKSLSQIIAVLSNRYYQLTGIKLQQSEFKSTGSSRNYQNISKNYGAHRDMPVYKKTWFIWLFLVILPPIGLILLWYFSDYTVRTKKIIIIVFGAILISSLFF